MEAGQSSKVISLDMPVFNDDGHDDDENLSLIDGLGVDSEDNRLLNSETLKTAMKELGDRERQVLTLRYFDGYTQREIARKIDISQTHVSRILLVAIRVLRKNMNVKVKEKVKRVIE